MSFLRGVAHYSSSLFTWICPTREVKPLKSTASPLVVFYRLSEQLFKQARYKHHDLENHHYITVSEGDTSDALVVKSLSISPEDRAWRDKVKYLATKYIFGTRVVSARERECNQVAWKLFKKAIIDQLGQERFDWICDRYKYELPIQSLESGDPLLVRYIRIFYIGLSLVDIKWIGKQLSHENLVFKLNRSKLDACLCKGYERMMMRPEEAPFSSLLRLSPRPRGALFGVGSLYQDERKSFGLLRGSLSRFQPIPLERISPSSCVPPCLTTPFVPWLEEFCKDTVNRELLPGQLIPVSGEDGQVDYYRVYARVLAKGLLAYGLTPLALDSQLKPLIVFRPTQRELGAVHAIDTFKNDVELNIGSSGWLAAQDAFKQLLADPNFKRAGKKITIAGYSVGGAHLQYFLFQFPEQVAQAFSFNAPSIDKRTAKLFADSMNRSRKNSVSCSLYIIRCMGDHVPKFGQRHLGHGVQPQKGVDVRLIEVDFQDPHMNWEKQHSARAFGSRSCHMRCYTELEELRMKLDNSKRGPDVGWYQWLHYQWGWVAFYFFQFLEHFLQLLQKLSNPESQSAQGSLFLRYEWE